MKQFPPEYAAQLRQTYGQAIADQIVEPAAVMQAHIPEQLPCTVPFVNVRPPDGDTERKPILFVPGFSEGIINKASFAAEVVSQGGGIILPGQNRKGILKDTFNKRSSLYSQACSYLAVHDAVGRTPVDVTTHSYGSLIFDEMVRVAPERFKDSNVVMLAPAGSVYDQRLLALGRQWVRMIKSENTPDRPMEFPDEKGYTGRASALTLLANVPRTLFEVRDLWKRNVNYERIAQTVGSLTVFTYAEDWMYPQEEVTPTLTAAVEAGHISWAMPVSLAKVATGEMTYGGDGATHDDEQFNPSRVASAVLQVLAKG